jgi:hypothetical protein
MKLDWVIFIAVWFLILGFILGQLASDTQKTPSLRLCPDPYDTILAKEGVICRMHEAPETVYYIQSQDGLITMNCSEKPQVFVREILMYNNGGK